MIGTASEKHPGGKLVRVKLNFDNGKIFSAAITGDFFIHPEDKINELEEIFIGKSIFFEKADMLKLLEGIVEKHDMKLVGITPEYIVKIAKDAIAAGTEKSMQDEAEKKKKENS